MRPALQIKASFLQTRGTTDTSVRACPVAATGTKTGCRKSTGLMEAKLYLPARMATWQTEVQGRVDLSTVLVSSTDREALKIRRVGRRRFSPGRDAKLTQTLPMCPASSSEQVNARRGILVPSLIRLTRQTLRRAVNISKK